MTSSAEKFEILSAYLDNEASPEECRLVEQWLECDPLFLQQYQAQLRLKTAIRSLSVTEKSSQAWSVDYLPIDNRLSGFCMRKPAACPKLGTRYKFTEASYMAIARRRKEFILMAVALSAASVTALSFSTLKRSSGWRHLRRSAVVSNAANAPSHQTFQSAVESY